MENVLYQDEIYTVYMDPEEGMMVDYTNSCKYKVARNEAPIISYLCKKIRTISNGGVLQ